MVAVERRPLWSAVELALLDARAQYARKYKHLKWTEEAWLAGVRETGVTISISPGMTQQLAITFHHKVRNKGFVYYYSLRRQEDDTYTIYDVASGSRL